MLDGGTSRYLARLAEAGVRPLHECSVAQARRTSRELAAENGPGPRMHRAFDDDAAGVPVRVLVPIARPRGVVVWLHPGCWVCGGPAEIETIARKLAERTSCAWIVPAYRLAPEQPFPAAVDDAQAALEWAAEHAAGLAGPGAPVVVGGEGAGGTLAAVAARRARDRGAPAVAMQVLVCPISDAATDGLPAGEALFTADSVRWAIGHYAPDPATRGDPDVSPARAESLAGLPPALIVAAGEDPLRAQNAAYADALRDAGVPVTLREYAGQMHGFFSILELRLGERAFQDVVRAVRACVARARTSETVAAGGAGWADA